MFLSDPAMDVNAASFTYKELVSDLTTNKGIEASSIVISSVPPRNDDHGSQQRVDSLNAALTTVAVNAGVTFIDNNATFRLHNGDPNDGYLSSDGLHLSKQGTNRIVKNLKVPIKVQHQKDVTKSVKPTNHSPKSWVRSGQEPHRRTARQDQPRNDNSGIQSRRGCYHCGESNHVSSS